MPKVLIIGIGNTLRRDDGLGWCAGERLMELLPPDRAQVMVCHQLSPELAEAISQSGLVVFIDAAADGTPGDLSVKDVNPDGHWGAFMHWLDPPGLLGAARDLYGAFPPAKLLSVPGESFELGEQMSPPVSAALEQVVARVQQMVADFVQGRPGYA